MLEHIFLKENQELEHKIPEKVYDLLSDWFKQSGIGIADFETDFFEPVIRAYRTLENENRFFENNYEHSRRNYYFRIAYLYLAGRHPDNQLLNRLLRIGNTNGVPVQVTGWYSHASLAREYPELFTPLETGAQIARYHHAIHERIDQNISYLPGQFAQLKFTPQEAFFTAIFNYVTGQTFEEKPYLLFLLYKSTTRKYDDVPMENGEYPFVEVSDSPYDTVISNAFNHAIEEYNRLYHARLSREIFDMLAGFLSYKDAGKKAKITIENFEEARTLISRAAGNELLLLEHIIYFLKNEHLYEQDKYWKVLLTELCGALQCNREWLEGQISFLLSKDEEQSSLLKNEIRNEHLIFKYIITPLLQNLSASLQYNDRLVQLYESQLFRRTRHAPWQKGVDLLRSIAAATIKDEPYLDFINSRLSSFYYLTNATEYSGLYYDENDKTFSTIKNFVDELNVLVPVALKKVIKNNYYSGDGDIFILNHAGKDINISKSFFIRDINALLAEVNSPYRLSGIPLALKAPGWHRVYLVLYALAFMNEQELEYAHRHQLATGNIEQWFVPEKYNSFKAFQKELTSSENIRPVFGSHTGVPFRAYKQQQKQENKEPGNNLFLSDINWNWFRDKYIDQLSSKEQWYGIMNVMCQCPKGKKPTAAWIASLQKMIEPTGAEQYFKELQVLVAQSIKEESWLFGQYAQAFKGLIWSCACVHPNSLSLSILKTIAEHFYTKIPNVGAISTATGNLALEALAASEKEEAFGLLNIMRNKTKYNKFVLALEKSMDKFRETSTIPEQLLADRCIPDFGFQNGKKIFGLPGYKVIVSFENKKLVKQFEHESGKMVKQLPASVKTEEAKLLKEINEEIKQTGSVFNDLGNRVRTYWMYARVWTYADWNSFINNHELVYPHVETLIWTNITQQKDFILLNHHTLDAGNQPVVSEPGDEIYLWHPINNTEENIGRWQSYLWVNNRVQSQRQAFRESYPFSETERSWLETPRFAHHFLEVNKLMAIANNTGWIFTYVHEGDSWPRIYLKPLDITAHLYCDYDRYSFAIPTKQLYFTRGNTTKINDYRSKQPVEKIKLGDIPPVTLSEICRDIDLFIATTSIANNVELSGNRQEYEHYRMEYEKGLFSENANAKIRRLIIEKMAPVLKLNILYFEGNFVIVKGKTEDYRINLNSGFAQTLSTQKHVNLLPEIKKLKADKKLRLPVEDDETLYIILAKMLHLQEM